MVKLATRKFLPRYGWTPDTPDHRDLRYTIPRIASLPAVVDLRRLCPPVYDQGDLGSCTANGIAAAHQFDQMKQKASQIFFPSRLFIYYNERVIEKSVKSDSGAQIRDGIKSIGDKGVCDEKLWTYDITKFTVKPSAACYKSALDNQAISYARVDQSLTAMKAIAALGEIFVFGFAVYESFESATVAKTGNAPMPKKTESCLGGHCVVCVGYDDSAHRFICRNSWGTGWGQKGYFTLPYTYLLDPDLCDDFWVVKTVEAPKALHLTA